MKTILTILILLSLSSGLRSEQYHHKWLMIGHSGGITSSEEMTNHLIIGQSIIGRASDGKYVHETGFMLEANPFLRYSQEREQLPQAFALGQNYPNPFNPTTTIEYALPEKSQIRLDMYNILGQKVATLAQGEQTAGYHSVTWNAHDCASGIYFCRLSIPMGSGHRTDIKSLTRRLTLLK